MTKSHRIAPLSRRAVPLALAGLLALTACGGSEEDAGTAAPSPETSSSAPSTAGGSPSAPAEAETETEVEAETGTTSATASLVDFDIELSETELAAGEYEIEVTNDGGASHDLVVERDGEDVAATEVLSPGGSETLAVTLEPGEYVFYCSVGTHRSMGMEITVTVS
ncbi:cupredoxin domain-containing protein [Blastococcus goldschmidtiae]|uniref:Cupredoxin domain-containing protein n=1 Tax=Blastococcus goldschmidtiae TaxID=3075546 RepID=A0ABU2K8W7_9ACTN|nr:cupredoxin domain-containing protein [Blastococcus sp. DSM 46792]MDT0276588.1 cupredoxin domain-containing protein [Blastococcus sp. DSM 46792]